MSDNRKKRLSMLDGLTRTNAAAAPPMAANNRALRSARDAVDGHRIWDLDPAQIDDDRTADRLDPADIEDLRISIEAVGQTVPILVRRDPQQPDRYQLVYGRRRLEAVRASDRVAHVRAMIAAMDDKAALRAQASENTARRDLSFIERALFALELGDAGFGTQAEIAEMLNMTKSAISMSLSIARAVGRDLIRAIGPAHGIGRPRWEAVARDLQASDIDRQELIALAWRVGDGADVPDPSVAAFDAVARRLRKSASPSSTVRRNASQPLFLDGEPAGRISRTPDGLRLDIRCADEDFIDWLQGQIGPALQDLRARWKSGSQL